MDKLKITQELIAVSFSLLGGLVHFIVSKRHTFMHLITCLTVAAFMGWLTVLLCKEAGLSDNIMGAASGMSGFSGISLLKVYEEKFMSKINKNL